MAKLCVGVYEKKRAGYVHPLFWVNTNIFDYRAKLKWKHTLHMWNYSLGKKTGFKLLIFLSCFVIVVLSFR